jgi:pimeloyl-ACP methyl ester carboxylesterase
VAFRKKVYRSLDELQADLDAWLAEYNGSRPHQGRWCFGKTPMQTFLDAMPMTKEKMIAVAPLAEARVMAARIPNARFVLLDSANHLVLDHEPAWIRALDAIREFLSGSERSP